MKETTPSFMSRQREVGAASRLKTQVRLRQAAGEEFTESGYAKATVSNIAKRAGVTVQTLYLAWGSKRELLRAFMKHTLAGNDEEPGQLGDRFADLPPRVVITRTARLVAEIAKRSATGWKLYRDASATDPKIAEDWTELQRLRRETFASILSNIPSDALRAGLTSESARDTAWAIASPEMYEVLVSHAGYTIDEFEAWLDATLAAALLRQLVS